MGNSGQPNPHPNHGQRRKLQRESSQVELAEDTKESAKREKPPKVPLTVDSPKKHAAIRWIETAGVGAIGIGGVGIVFINFW
jgi:hypothetical protein